MGGVRPAGLVVRSENEQNGSPASRNGHGLWLWRWLSGKLIDREAMAREHARLRQRDDLPTRLHEAAAIVTFFLLPMPTSVIEIAAAPIVVMFFVRAVPTWRLWTPLWTHPLQAFCILFAAWVALGMIWSPDPGLGLEELGGLRWLAMAPILQPVMHIRWKLVLALMAGFAVGHAVQLGNLWALRFDGPPWLAFGRLPDRISGWWDPAVAGVILTAAFGLYLPIGLFGRGRGRLASAVGAALTLAALIATGSRAGWLACFGLAGISGLVFIAKVARTGRAWILAIGLGAVALAVVVAGVSLSPAAGRVADAVREVRAALVEGNPDSDTGARIERKQTAIEAWAARPVAGVGTGGYGPWSREHASHGAVVHDHAHDTLLHVLASNGLIGGVLLVGIGGVALWQGVQAARGRLGTLDASPLFALIGLGLVSVFDTLHASASAAAIAGGVIVLCAGYVPPRSLGDPRGTGASAP